MKETIQQWVTTAGFGLIWFYLGYSVGVEKWKGHWDKVGDRIANRIKKEGIKVVDDHIEPDVIEMFDKAEVPKSPRSIN